MTAEKSTDLLLLDNQLCFALYSASNAIVRAYRPLLEQLDLTYPQYLVMLVLWQQDGVSVKQLGEQLFLDSGTLTPLLKRLDVKGLVRRERSEQDERIRVLTLTEQGKALKTGRRHSAQNARPASYFRYPTAGAEKPLRAGATAVA